MLKTIGMFALAAAAVVGCKKKDGDGGGAAKGADSDLPDEVAKWMPADVQKAWEGAWNGHISLSTSGAMSMAGTPQALQIKDGKATAFDGKEEKTVDFAIKKPCEVGFMVGASGGAVYTFSKKFVHACRVRIRELHRGRPRDRDAAEGGPPAPLIVVDHGLDDPPGRARGRD